MRINDERKAGRGLESLEERCRSPWGWESDQEAAPGPSHKGSVSLGLPTFFTPPRGSAGTKQNKKCLRKLLPGKILPGLFLSEECVSIDDFKHPESTGAEGFLPRTRAAPAQPFLGGKPTSPHREDGTPLTISLPVR